MGYGVTTDERARNRRVAILVQLLPLVVVAFLGAIAGLGVALAGAVGLGVVIAIAGVVLGGLIVTLGLLAGFTHVERLLGAHRIPEGSEPRVENLVEGLCATFGVGHPPLFVVEEPRINLAMVATSAGAVMVVTRGLLERLDLMELEGVLAHGLAHLRLDDVKRGTLAASLPGILGNDTVRHRLAGRGRLLRADEIAAAAVRYPVGIASVLDRCRTDVAPDPSSLFATERFERTRWLWFDPLPGDPDNELGELDAPTVRAQALAEW
jgi:hypothetical protein